MVIGRRVTTPTGDHAGPPALFSQKKQDSAQDRRLFAEYTGEGTALCVCATADQAAHL
jgi:hypothetical protein